MKYLIFFLLFWIIFATYFEHKSANNPYSSAKVKTNDSIITSLRKIRYCMTYELRVIKWRRSFISAVLATFLIFLLCWNRIPTPQELLTHLLIITVVFSGMWSHFSDKTSTNASFYCDENITNIKKILKKNRSFILPSTW